MSPVVSAPVMDSTPAPGLPRGAVVRNFARESTLHPLSTTALQAISQRIPTEFSQSTSQLQSVGNGIVQPRTQASVQPRALASAQPHA